MGLFAKAASLRDRNAAGRGPAREPTSARPPAPEDGDSPHLHEGLLHRTEHVLEHGSESPEPVVESPEPLVESPEPLVESPEPLVESPEPVVESPEPLVESPEPLVELPEPVVESPEPLVELPEPVVESPEPVAEAPASLLDPEAASLSEQVPGAEAEAAARLAGLVAEVMAMRAGIDAPGILFELLRRTLHFERGAILVPDGGGRFTPWAALGLDVTSRRRLSLADSEAAALTPATLEGPALHDHLRLFSSRDSATLERLSIWPCPGPRGPAAVLVFPDRPPGLASSPELDASLPELLEAFGRLLEERRERTLSRMRDALAGSVGSEPEAIVEAALGRIGGDPPRAFLLRASLTPLLEAVAAAAPSVDTFRLAEDLCIVVGWLCRGSAQVVLGSTPKEIVLLLPAERPLDAELLLHALIDGLRTRLPVLPSIEPRAMAPAVARCPEDGRTAEALLAAAR